MLLAEKCTRCPIPSRAFCEGGRQSDRTMGSCLDAARVRHKTLGSTATRPRAAQTQLACLDQGFGFGCEPRSSRDTPQFGKICSMEYVTKAALCRRLSRRVNMIASKNPVTAPRNASVIERLLKVRSPWPVRRNPVYAIATVQRITRAGCMGDYLSMNKYCCNSAIYQ
jgi:hypothetical protein